MATNQLHAIEELGQAVWLDNISRELIEDGELKRLVEEDRGSGVTSNPTSFEKAMGEGDRYDAAYRDVVKDGVDDASEAFFRVGAIAIRDARDGLKRSAER